MSINIKKYTKEQMAGMVEEAQEEAGKAAAYEKQWRVQVEQLEDQVRTLKQRNVVLTESIEQMNGEAINKANEIAKLKAELDESKKGQQYLNDQGREYWRAWQASKQEVADLKNKLNDTELALGRANAELGAAEGALGEMDDLRTKLADAEEKKERMNATLADCRATFAQKVEKLNAKIKQLDGEAIDKSNEIARLKEEISAWQSSAKGAQTRLHEWMNISENASERAKYAENHPWRNLWAWIKRKFKTV